MSWETKHSRVKQAANRIRSATADERRIQAACRPDGGHIQGLTGIVLAGGTSSRLGRDKTALVIGESGQSMLVRTARLLRQVVPEVIISGRSHEEFPALPDDMPGTGPVGAITTALRHTGTACLVLACDMPFMDERILRILLHAWSHRPEGSLVTALVHPDTGRKENLVAVYEQGALRYLEPSLRANLLKIALVVPEEYYCFVPVPEGASEAFFNINRPADLKKVEERLDSVMPDHKARATPIP